MSLAPRQRKTGRDIKSQLPSTVERDASDNDEKLRHGGMRGPDSRAFHNEHLASHATALGLTVLAFIVRFWRISHPSQVVFDEVHFGAFAGQYIRREYYFDVHPPLAKLLNGLAAWFVGFNGDFGFENIGDDYVANNVPYIGMRAYNAILGSLTVPVVFAIMRESGYPIMIATFSASLILFDNAHITQTRLILLDSALVLFMAASLLSYVKFHQQRYREFSAAWWFWLLATGCSLGCTLGCKMVGLFTFMTIGSAVLWDLWGILDIKRGHSMAYFNRHFMYRALGLIVFPFILYLTFFWIHFKILIYSGPGDSFMSPAFQETLQGNEMLLNSQEIRYLDTVTIRHKDSKNFLHSHVGNYPLRYDDGRISSQGQQVTAYPHNDTNNHWQIMPTKELPATGRGRIVRHEDVIQLRHVGTDTILLTHDVASPLMATNQEFTTVSRDDEERYNDTLFKLDINDAHLGEAWKSKSGHFRLMHVPTHVMLWTHSGVLPAWAFGQNEVNGNKNPLDRTTTWFVDDIIEDGSGNDYRNRTLHVEPKKTKKRSFIKKFVELQILMLQHNAGLTASHPYASTAVEWPFDLSGISFWTDNDLNQQIYLIGNLIGWWMTAVAVSVFVGIIGADMLARRRGLEPIEDGVRNRLYRNTGFFIGAWAFHYFPFYLMSRQLFLHHYLPAHVAAALTAGSVLNFVLVEAVNYPISAAGLRTRLRPVVRVQLKTWAVATICVLMLMVVGMWLWLAPLTYGLTLTGEAVNRRKLLSSWTLHFEGKKTHAMA